MIVTNLTAACYRNCSDTELSPCPGVNVLYGDNAQGKTNLLEAIWLFTGSRSFRGTKDADLVQFGGRECRLAMKFDSHGRQNEAELHIEDARQARLNGVSLESPLKMAGEFCAVIFSPEHLGLVKGAPQVRRKYIDSAICQLWPRHLFLLSHYNKALSHRNALLKDIPFHSELMDTAEIWNEKLAHTGAQIVYARLRYLDLLQKKAQNIYSGISGGEEFSIDYRGGEQQEYRFDPAFDKTRATEELYGQLLANLGRHLRRDIESGFTHDGPHRDDLEINVTGLSARLYGSQGQQRSAALTLKLAEASLLLDVTGEPPVLLLDDVMSELDSARQDYILNNVGGWQVFITCCDPSILGSLTNGRVFHVEQGRIE